MCLFEGKREKQKYKIVVWFLKIISGYNYYIIPINKKDPN